MSTRLSLALYRMLLRQARDMSKTSVEFQFTKPMDQTAWLVSGGAPGWIKPEPQYSLEALAETLPFVCPSKIPGGVVTGTLIKSYTEEFFRKPLEGSETAQTRVDMALEAVRALEEQKFLSKTSSTAITDCVRVDVTASYLGTQQDDFDDDDLDDPPKYFYTYRIRVSNQGSKPVQILSRHWKVFGKNGQLQVEVPKGSRGVVGHTPIIKPNTCFSYYSGTDLEGKGGSMEGSFHVTVLDGEGNKSKEFDAVVARFQLG